MITLFNRTRKVQVGNFDVSHLDCSFTIKRTLRGQPNTCDLIVWNMKRDSLAAIRDTEDLFVEVSAGYASSNEPTLLFRGNANREVFVRTDKTENILQVKARDGRRSSRARVNRSYGANVPVRQVIRDVIGDMGIGEGNLGDFLDTLLETTNSTNFPHGFVASGQAITIVDRIMRAQGLRWSVQNGNLQVLHQRRSRLVSAKLINSETGLIGSPQRDKLGKVTLSVLMQPGIEPGRIVRVRSRFIDGDYEIQETLYKGKTIGSNAEWQANLVLKPLETS